MLDYSNYINFWDILLPPFYLIIVLFTGFYIKNLKYGVEKKEHYRYFMPALVCKVIASIIFCLIYSFYYNGGDTTNYFLSAAAFANVLTNDGIGPFLEAANFYNNNIGHLPYFNETNGYIYYVSHDYYALMVVLLTSPICLVTFNSFLASSIVLSALSFIGLWKLYEVFVYYFPDKHKNFAIVILFIPSVIFWGSGILKDTYTFSFTGIFTYCFWKYFIIKRKKLKYLFLMLTCAILILLIKPYIIAALMPGTLIWLGFNRIAKIRNPFLKTFFIPIIFAIFGGLIMLSLSYLGEYLGEYSMDNVLNKAVKTQQDLIREQQYGKNNYDIGAFDASLAGITAKIPEALNLALFRPYVWEAKNAVMILSGIENLMILGLTLYVLITVKIKTIFKLIISNPLLLFSLLFALFFAFSVGLTTANFGALVRLKIPCIPFYAASLLMIYELSREKRTTRI